MKAALVIKGKYFKLKAFDLIKYLVWNWILARSVRTDKLEAYIIGNLIVIRIVGYCTQCRQIGRFITHWAILELLCFGDLTTFFYSTNQTKF